MACLHELVQAAIDRRAPLLARLADEDTNAVRLFHGVSEGRPGLAVGRYGAELLAQVWHSPPSAAERESLEAMLGPITWRYRGETQPHTESHWVRERGLRFRFQGIHAGLDPFLFLDLRSGRRWLAEFVDQGTEVEVLNCFAYTATAGVVAATAGATRVVNLDHAQRWTETGHHNALENGVAMEFLQMDFFVASRQMAGLSVGRAGRRLPRVAQARFDVVVLDPPTRTKGPFGAVDIENDYEGLFKPAWLCLKDGGALLATNHSPKVDLEDWLLRCRRCAAKAGRPVQDVRVIDVDCDFPSFDGSPPLKIAVFQ